MNAYYNENKSNYGPPQPDIWLRRGPHGVLFQHEVTASQEEKAAQTSLIAAIIKVLSDEGPATKTAFINKHSGLNGTFKTPEKALSEAIDQAVGSGVLAYQEGTRADRRVLVVVQQTTRMEF